MRSDPKPASRVRSAAGRVACRRKVEAEGRCRACGRRPSGHHLDSLNFAHLVGGSRREWVPEAGVPLCGSGTTGCHGILTSHARGWQDVAANLNANLRQEEWDYAERVGGAGYVDRHYPPF